MQLDVGRQSIGRRLNSINAQRAVLGGSLITLAMALATFA